MALTNYCTKLLYSPSFGDDQDHPGSTSEALPRAAWHGWLAGYVLGGREEVPHSVDFHSSLWEMEQGALSQDNPQTRQERNLFFFFPGSSLQVWKRVLVYSLAPNKHLHAFAHCCRRSSLSPLIHPGLPCLCTPVTPGELGSYQKAVNHLKHPLTSFCRSSLRSRDKFQLLAHSSDATLERLNLISAKTAPGRGDSTETHRLSSHPTTSFSALR